MSLESQRVFQNLILCLAFIKVVGLIHFETKSRETLNFEGNKFHCVITTDTDNEINRSKRKTKALIDAERGRMDARKWRLVLLLTLVG